MDGYYAFMLIATALVLMMTVPALALFYGGMSRSKSVLNMMMMSYIAAAIVGILYVAVGWSMGFGGEGTFFANPFELFWLDGVTTDNYVFVMFQMTFAIITTAPEPIDLERVQERELALGGDDEQAVGLRRPARHLCKCLRPCDPDRHRESDSLTRLGP